ncbi:hypothetical protein LGH70_19480 [Hymenobacter sp. BT635]|uniref:Nucleotidyltransferase n=1 Tax=Hymenobacter nitidus TaxID=2880929 RepID=A0ABS8AHF7_9BACT|nr:hypothetical protein [Hymenobacter nitidus]MCB2379787.1 hypothetical protein [Hymenobacter nitidus]
MARTIPEIFDSIQVARATSPELAALSSPSATALHRLWAYVVATVHHFHEVLMDGLRADVDTAIANNQYGTPTWFQRQVLLFQLNDTLEVRNNIIQYKVGSTGARIVTRAAAKEDTKGKLIIKVAGLGTTADTLRGLTDEEQVQVFSYLDRIRPAGVKISLVSREADRLQLHGQVYYDPLRDLEGQIKPALRAGLTTYTKALDFAGVLYKAKLVDEFQKVPGIIDQDIVEASIRLGNDLPVVFDRVWETRAGYVVEEDESGLSWLDTLEFIPYNG